MKKTRMPQRLLSLVLVLMMLISVLPVSAMAAELTPSDPETGLTATDVTNELTDSDRLAIFEDNMDSDKVSKSEIPADDEMVRVIVQLDADSLLDVRNRTNASMSMLDFQQTDAAKAQLKDIANLQLSVMNTMESKGIPSSFTFSYTSVVSGFAAQVPYGKIHEIKSIDGVEDVVLCQTYYTDSMGSATLGQALTAAEVAAYSNNTQYQGEGMLIGILDTGLDVNHEAFANAPAVQKLQKSSLSKLLYQISQGEDGKTNITAYSYAALWYAQKHSSSSLVLLTEDDLYKSGKVPFAFDYADADADVIPSADAVEKYGNDHGTHVAGITAGKTVDADGSVTFAGQSPEAQLAIFKVFSDSTNGASTDTILAALNDALLLDVDVINMSLGSNGGFGREAEGDLTTKYYDLVKSAGILLNCSAGNSYSSSQGGAKGDFTSVSDPDTGIISSSSSYDAALSVASVNANETAAFVTAQGRVPYQDVSGHDFTALLLGNDSSKTYEYVMVPNTGDTADYQGLDVTGKIAVVMRGGLSFEQKQLNAASAGAAGCIIYNNRDGYLLNMAVDNYKIPTVCISLANGQMMEAAQEKTLTVSKTEKGSVAMSDFSSWGPLPSLSLKPEITAPGGSIYSSLPFAQYGYMSGTSMASPYLAGVSAAALEYVNTLMPGASDTDKQLLVNRLLMSTADILYDENGVAYSPRKQGSGMVNLAEAVTTPAYLYVRGQDKTKIELGDDADQLGVYKLSFVVKNLTGSALSYDVNTTVQTESTTSDGLYIAQKGYVLSADTSAIKVSGGALSGSTVTVPANGETTVTVTVRLSDADRAYLAKFPNGIYVEGFVELTNNDDPALSVPFLGFYGDWTKAPIFEDADIYNGLDEKMYATNVAGVYAMMYVVKLGMYPFVVPEGYDTPSTSADKICVDLGGGNGVSNLYYLQAGLLRAAKTTNVTITDSDTGQVYLNSDGLNVRKAMYNSSSAAVRPGYVGEIFPPLTGIHLIPNNTRMTYTAAAYVDGFDVQDNLKNTYSFNFTSDGEMPYIVDRENLQFRTGDDGRKYLDVTLADNFCLAGATLYSTQWKTNVNNGKKEMSIGSNYYDGIIPALKADGTSPRAYEEYTYTFDVTDFYQKLLQGTFYVVAYDYAMNQCAYRVTLPENAVTKITLDQTAVTLPQKGYVQLNATVTPDDATDQNLVWSSSDSSVAEVKNGIVAAKAPGTATITVKSSVWTDVEAQCQVTVTDEVGADVPMSEFLLNTSSVTMLAGTTYTNVRLYGYAPFYATDLNLEWTSSDESVVTVEPNGEGDQLTQYAKLTALKPGTATVTAKAKNGTASYDLAVTVTEATGSGSFNIVGDTLVSYSGTESTVTIPDGVRVIGENAFKNNDYVLNVICPDSLEEIGYRAFYDCDNLQSVSLPETMKVINEGAFYYCKNLKTLGHTDDGVLPKGLTSIGVKAFYFCEALEGDLVIPEGVTSLSAGIFYNAYTLTSITIPDTVTSMDANGDQFANCTAVTSVTLSKNLTELPKTAFFTLKSLKHLPDLSNVTSVGTSCFAGCAALEEMVIPESLTFIGANAFARSSLTEITVLGDPTGLDSAFYNSLNLTTFVAPKLTTIGKQMFQGCTALVNFIVPDNVTLIGERAFQGCTNLKTLTFPASYKAETLSFGLTPFVSCPAFEGYVIEDGASIVRTEDGTLLAGGGKVLVSLPRDFKGTSYTVPDGVETISDYLFYKNTTITSVTLPASLKKIGTAAFQGCTKLTSIALPDGFTTLGEHAFDGCSGLKTVTFGQSLTAVPAYAFSNCSALTAVDLPATVETVGDYAFRGCAKATALSLKEGLTSIGANAFYGWKALKAITIPQSVTSLGGSAFYDCNAAASIDCGSLTVIPERAFYNAKAVKTVKLSDNVTSIGERAFYSCSLLETINWPSQLKTIGRQAFYYARKLQNLDFSGTQLESIGNSAFYQPYEARTLAFPGTLQSIDSKAFAYLNYNKTAYVTEVNIPASVTSLAKDAFYLASGLKNIVVDANNPVYASSNGVVMLKDTGDIYIWPQGNETTEFTLPATMTEIPDKMFQNNTSLKKVIVPASVTKVGSYAFSSSKIEEIYFEGYVYADEVASAEGVKGDSHSIPVLGYYGSWTDPSMFDIGSYLEYHEAKTESRVPYMYAYNKNATKYQALTVQYAGDSGMYYFGGNPYVDETYDPNRAAINPDTTVFARATFSLIRNAADSRATITGENGTVYYDKASGSPTAGAYYYSNGGSWRNAQGYIGINNAPTKAAEGEKITVKVTEAPEYYVTYDAEGNATTNWDALGDGASRTYTAFIDRTEPVLSNVYFKEDVETGTRSLVLTAQDNRYVAAAFLIDYDKMSILDRTAGSPEGAAEGAATDISLNLSKAEGVDHLLVQVADYADNTATYKINLNKEELSGPVSVTLDKQSIKMYKGGTAALNAEVSPFGVKPDGVTWKSSDETVATVNERGIVTGVNKGTATITAASIKDPTATASCVVTVQTVDTTLVGALMDTNGDAQFYTWDMEHDTTWKKLVNFETTKSVSASTFDARTGNVYLQDGSFNINKMDLDTGKTLATYPGFEGEIPMWDMEYSLVYSTEAKPMLASVYATYFLSPKPVDNLDLSAFDLGLYLWLFADASYFTAVTSLGANKIDTDDDGVKDTDTELFLALDDAGNIWTMNVYPTKDEKTGKDTWGASFGIIESNLANVGYAANPTDDGDLYDSLYATVEGQELVLYLANFTGDASHVYRILLNEDTGKWEAADIGNFGDGVWPATLVGTMYHANEDAAKAVNAAMSKTTVHTAQAVEMTPAQIQRYNGAETQAAKGSLNTAAPVAAVVNLPMGDAAENATASNVTVSADEKTVTVNVLAKDAATNGLFTVDYDAANLTLTNVAFNTQYSSYKDASGKVTLGYVDLNGVTAGSTVATLTFTVKDPTALDKINVTVTETERNDQTVNNAETLTADLHTETETVNAKAATCTEDGYTGDVVCKACGKVITKGEVIPALGHKIELVGAKAATCTEDGYTGDEVCTICGEIVKKGEVIKATGHQYKDGKCTVCGAADPNYKPSVKTGDESNTALWVLVMASAALLAAAVVVLPRKKHSR